jgi:hypothetical protein
MWAGYWDGLSLNIPFVSNLLANNEALRAACILSLLIAAGYVHFRIRRMAAERVKKRVLEDIEDPNQRLRYTLAFRKNSRWWRSIFQSRPAGWNKNGRKVLSIVAEEANTYIQILNDTFTNPSGNPLFGDPYDQYVESKNAAAIAEKSAPSSRSFKEQALKVITGK